MRSLTGPEYFDREGRPIDRSVWAERFEHDPGYRRIALTSIEVGDGVSLVAVSTVWMGFDLGVERLLRPERGTPPLIFETSIFRPDDAGDVFGRTATEADARATHDHAVAVVRSTLDALVAGRAHPPSG